DLGRRRAVGHQAHQRGDRPRGEGR
ncbi:MAG: Translation initiation factor 3, partial [uncultured Rubrobacteraceae bacterium]